MTELRRHDVDDRRAPARAPVADQLGLQLTGYRRLEITALDDERAAADLGQQAPAAGASDFPRIDRHAPRKVPGGASPKVAKESLFCRFFRRQNPGHNDAANRAGGQISMIVSTVASIRGLMAAYTPGPNTETASEKRISWSLR
jgi:hypothetical protein